jgi:hypothetical protein
MHDESRAYVARAVELFCEPDGVLLDIGGRNVNGSMADLYEGMRYVALDLRDAPGVDIVADACTWTPDRLYDVVVCTSVLEHVADWPAVVATAAKALRERGTAIFCTVGAAFPSHSGIDGEVLRDGEHYGPVELVELVRAMRRASLAVIDTLSDPSSRDTCATGVRLRDIHAY